jgi:Flp pilus assembly protein, protease CpaA
VNLIVLIALTSLTALACWTDLRKRLIPNALTVSYACGGLLYHGAAFGWKGLAESLIGGVAGMAPLLLMYVLKGIGGGDVKWFAAFGVWSGASFALQLVVHSILAAGVIALIMLLIRRIRNRETKEAAATFPFMAAVAPALAFLLSGEF